MGDGYSIEIRSVTKRFDDVTAVDGVSLNIQRGEFFSLLGPSGCGKTTLLRMIAGFEQPTAGSILIHGRDVTHVPPYGRPAHMVFQHYALFPHLTVEKNVAFGLRYKSISRAKFSKRVGEALSLVRLAGLERRYPDQLSGGQRQRVALARALVLEPEVLLLDEPLGALDQKLRKEMQVELKNLQRALEITFVFVTHDQEEALTMSDRVAVMNAGRVEQADAAAEVFERPATEFVAQFMGATNFFTGAVAGSDDRHVWLTTPGDIELSVPLRDATPPVGSRLCFVVRPEKMSLGESPQQQGRISIPVTLVQRIYQGVNTIWTARDDAGTILTICRQNSTPDEPDVREGGRAFVSFDPRHAVLLSDRAANMAAADAPALSGAAAPGGANV